MALCERQRVRDFLDINVVSTCNSSFRSVDHIDAIDRLCINVILLKLSESKNLRIV